MFFTVYKITNKINGKVYIGVHKTEDIDDGYMGSGVILNRAFKKHGLESFCKPRQNKAQQKRESVKERPIHSMGLAGSPKTESIKRLPKLIYQNGNIMDGSRAAR